MKIVTQNYYCYGYLLNSRSDTHTQWVVKTIQVDYKKKMCMKHNDATNETNKKKIDDCIKARTKCSLDVSHLLPFYSSLMIILLSLGT